MTHLWLLLFLNSWLKFEANVFGMNLIKLPDDNRAQVECTIALLGKYFHSSESLSGSVLQMSITSASTYLQQSLLKALHTNENYPWTIVVEEKARIGETKHVLYEKPQCYFLVIESMEDVDMDEICDNWKDNLNWNPLAQFVIYLSAVQETEEDMTEIMIEILFNFMSKKIFNVNIIGKNGESGFYFSKTVFPYHPANNCGNRVISVETIDICNYRENKINTDDENMMDGEQMEDKESEYNAAEASIDKEEHSYFQNTSYKLAYALPSNANSKLPRINKSQDLKNSKNELFNNTIQTDYAKFYIDEIYRALFLDKFPTDLGGCPVVAAFRPREPYIFKEVSDEAPYKTTIEQNQTFNYTHEEDHTFNEDNDEEFYDKVQITKGMADQDIPLNGIEYKMLQTIAERINISIEMQLKNNNNLYQILQKLMDGEIGMVVGGIDEDPEISHFISSSIPYYQDDLTWCVAKAQYTQNLFSFMAIFQTGTWLLILAFVSIASFSIRLSEKCLRLRLNVFKCYSRTPIYVIGILLNQAIKLKPIPTSLKLCFGTTFLMGFILSSIYQSFFISTLTTPKSSYQISNPHDIYQNRMKVMGSVDNMKHLYKKGEIYRYIREQFRVTNNIEESLQHAAKDSKLAVLVSRQNSIYNPRIPRDSLYCFDRNENIYVYLVTMLMPKKFHLLHKINPVIQHIIESGHMQKWARDIDTRRKISKDIQHARKGNFKSLTFFDVEGSFIFNCVLLIIALCVFVMECAISWLVVRRRTRFKLAKYVHRKFL